MANPTWFIEQDYLASKLKQLKDNGDTAHTVVSVKAAIEAAGFTTYTHFTAFGAAERTSPNALFNAAEYLAAKAQALSVPGGKVWTVGEVAAAFEAAKVSPWDHFTKWGAAEGINPSNAFDVSSYFDAKVAQLNASQVGKVWTVAEVKAAFTAAGLNPISHYQQFGSNESLTVTPVPAAEQVTPDPRDTGLSFTLTTDVNTIIGTDKNDTVTGTTATLVAGDTIIDQSSTDNDTLNLTLTAVNPAARISKIENINVNWDAFGDAGFDATNVTGATVTLSSTKVGYLGNATVTAAGANSVVAGSGMKGNLTVNGVTASTINAGAAKTVTADGTVALTDSVKVIAGASTTEITTTALIETATVTAGAATTKVTTNSATTTIDASAAAAGATILVNGTATVGTIDSATVKVGNDANVTTGANFTAITEKLTLDVAAGKVVTLVNTGLNTVEVKGAGDATLKISAANLDADTVTKSNAGNLTVEVTDAKATLDLTKVAATVVKLTGAGATVATVKSGANIEVSADLAAGGFTVVGGTSNNVNATFTKSQAVSTTFVGVHTANIVAAATQATAPIVTDLTFNSLINAGNTVNLSGTNDVAVTGLDVKTLDATNLNGELVVGGTAGLDVTIAGAQGKNDVTITNTALKAAFVGQSGADKVNFGTLAANAAVTAVTGAGNDTVIANAGGLTTGSLSIDAGAGDDVVELAATAPIAGSTIVVQLGDGNDTLKVTAASDFSLANLTVTGMEKLDIAGNATEVSASQFASFGSFQLVGTAALTVDGSAATTAQTIDASKVSMTFGTTATLDLKGGTVNDTIIGTIGNDTITGGAGADVLTGGAGADSFAYGTLTTVSAQTGITLATADTIVDFVSGTDFIKTGTAGGVVYSEAAAVADFATALAAANTAMGGGSVYHLTSTVADGGLLFVDSDANGTADALIKLTGITSANFAATDIIA